MKNFNDAFDSLLNKIKNKENFAFTRFSDGELFILQNKTVVLADNHYITGDIKGPNRYTKEEHNNIEISWLKPSSTIRMAISKESVHLPMVTLERKILIGW